MFTLDTDIVLYVVFIPQNCSSVGLEPGKNGILPFFGLFLQFGGGFTTPTVPAVPSFPRVSLPPYL